MDKVRVGDRVVCERRSWKVIGVTELSGDGASQCERAGLEPRRYKLQRARGSEVIEPLRWAASGKFIY